MSDYAGFAVAVTIHTQVFDDQFLSAWHNGLLSHWVSGSFGQIPATTGGVSLFFQPPQVICSDSNQVQAILRLTGWGTISVRPTAPGLFEKRNVQWQADLLITPSVSLSNFIITPDGKVLFGAYVILSAAATDYRLTAWQFDVLSGTAFSSASEAFLNSDTFKADLLAMLQSSIGDIKVPIMNFSALGPFSGNSFSNITLKVVGTGILLGIDMNTSTLSGPFITSGDITQLTDAAGTNDIEVIVNPDAILPLMPTVQQQVQQQIPQGATLKTLTIGCEEGQFRVKGSATSNDGTANFSLAAVPSLMTGVPGGIFPITQKKTITVRSRSWPALSFYPADVSVDVTEAAWIKALVLVGSILINGSIALFNQFFIWDTEALIGSGIQGADLNPDGALPLVQRIGSPPTRFGIQDFQVHPFGLYIGIKARLELPKPKLGGLKSIASNYVSQALAYTVTLPFDALEDDPFLRIRWTVVDLDSGSTPVNSDDVASGRLSFQFVPSAVAPGKTRFAVVCRVYRARGPFTDELFDDTIRLSVGPALPHNAYVRWTYQVLNPQFQFRNTDNPEAAWHLTGQSRIQRRSKIHRLDHPCRNANHRSRFTPTQELWDTLPFPVAKIDAHRDSLCDYCFYGGPGSTISSL